MSRLQHLAGRFVESLSNAPPDPDEERWLLGLLNPGETALYSAMSVADRRHAVTCGTEAMRLLGDQASPVLIVASALHDVGKTEVGLGTFGRVFATALVEIWPIGRVNAYAQHNQLGAIRLIAAGSAPEVVAWAREHHRSPSEWTLPEDIGRLLAEADGETLN